MGKIRINSQKLKGAVARAFDQTVDALSESFDDAITDDRYPWPRETQRRNGETVSSPRDIVDTGELLESKVISRSSTENAAEFEWTAPHAIHAHEGATLASGTELPARPWTEVGLELADPKKAFERELKKQL